MGSEVPTRPRRRKSTIAAAVAAGIVVVLLVAGLAFANSVGASRVADNARTLHWANAALGTSSLTRAALVQATTFVELREQGLASRDDVDFAIEQVVRSYEELEGIVSAPLAESSAAYGPLARFAARAAEALEELEASDASRAEALIVGELEAEFSSLSGELLEQQSAVQAEIDDNTATASRTTSYIVFILTLAIPAAAVLAYFWIARRQVREYRIKADADLEAERVVGRAKDAFIAGLSHELRTPLTSIYGFAEILTDGDPEARVQTLEIAQIIANESAELTRMVDDLLAAARLESNGLEIELGPTRIRDVIESAVSRFERAGADIRRTSSREVVIADGGRLRHVLVNLLSNAVRHGGPDVGIEVTQTEDTVDIEVWDNGAGIPDEQVDHLFDRFVHDGHETLLAGSVGLGLAVASRLTEMMGGELLHQRFSNKTYFVVRMPLCEKDESWEEESVADVIRAMSA